MASRSSLKALKFPKIIHWIPLPQIFTDDLIILTEDFKILPYSLKILPYSLKILPYSLKIPPYSLKILTAGLKTFVKCLKILTGMALNYVLTEDLKFKVP